MSAKSFLPLEKEALTELLAVSLGGSSAVLSEIFAEETTLAPPVLAVKQRDGILSDTAVPFFVVLGEYEGGVSGIQLLSISKRDVQMLAEIMEPESETEDMEKQFQVIQRVIEKMFGSVTKSMSMLLGEDTAYSLSGMDVVEKQQDFPFAKFTAEEWFIEVGFQLKIGEDKTAKFELGIPFQLAKQMTFILIGEQIEEDEAEEKQTMKFQTTNETITENNKNSAPNVQSVQFSSFDETEAAYAEPSNLNMLLDIPLQVTVELGRTKRMVKEILNMSQGSIIELDKLAGEPVDILINNKVIAVGEVVVIDENFGVRVTDILSTADRLTKLR